MQKTAICGGLARGSTRHLTKTFVLAMRLTIAFLTIVFLNVSATGISQTVNFTGKNVSLEQIFVAVEKQTGLVFFYNDGVLKNTRPVSISASQMPLTVFLDKILSGQQLKYSIDSKTITISRNKTDVFLVPDAPLAEQLKDQSLLPITGVVRSSDGQPISGVSIVIKGTKTGTTTDALGKFTLNAELGNILIISSVGFETREVSVSKELIIVSLQKKISVLDETQITAYGKTTRRLSTGSIGTVKAEDIEKQPVLTVMEALIGRVPGLVIRPLSGNSAAPAMVEIRGRNSLNPSANADPLYVIDGMPLTYLNANALNGDAPLTFSMGSVQAGRTNTYGENPLLNLNPKDIESIDVLKDADATAIYGSRGANGVILITTKKGKAGPPKIDLSISNGIITMQKYPKVLNTQEYLAVRREAFQNDGIAPGIYNAPDLTIWDSTKYTDWQRMLIGTGSSTNVNLGISGGVAQTTYGLSAGLASQKGILNNGGKNERVSFRSNLGHSSINQKFGLTISNGLALTDVNAYSIGDLSSTAPNAPDIYDEKGLLNFVPYRGDGQSIYPFSGLLNNSTSKTVSLQSNMVIRYEISKGLNLSTNIGYTFSSNENVSYTRAASQDPLYKQTSRAYYGNSTNNSWLIEPQLSYSRKIGRGSLSVQLIGSVQAVDTKGITNIGEDFPNDAMMKSINNAKTKTVLEGYREYRYSSGASVIKYNWANKYIINLNGRRDGSSRFGPGKQFGNFGSLGLAWIVSEEAWFKENVPVWFSYFKLRGSIGLSGSDGIGDYEFLSRWSSGYSLSQSTVLPTYNGTNAFHVVRPLNQQFQWESTKKTDLAVSIGLLENAINVEVNYYRNVSGNQLTKIPTASYTGFPDVTGNWGASVENRGLEISASAKLLNTQDWGVDMNFNFGTNDNKLLSFPGLDRSPHASRYTIGKSLSTVYLLHYTGIDPLTGNYTFEDHNKDGRISTVGADVPSSPLDDRYVIVNTREKYSGGFGLNVSYRQLALSTQFSYKNRLSNNPFLTAIGEMRNIVLPDDILENHWKQPGDLAKYPRFTTNGSYLGNIQQSDANYINGSYIRLSNIHLSYQLPANLLKKIRIKGASLSVSSQNFFTITSFKGYDPDLPVATNSTPIPRTISSSLNLNF